MPYGTALWQVNDAEECNGKFKFYLTLAKEEILKKRVDTFTSDLELLPYDIIPAINKAWNESFASVAGCKQAIKFRGWSPLNRNLLLHEALRPTMTCEDKEWERQCGLYPFVRFEKEQQQRQSTLAQSLPSMRNPATLSNASSLYVDPNTLNFSNDYAGITLQRLVGHEALEKARAQNDINRKKGESMRELFASLKRFTAGNLIKHVGTHELGKDLVYEMKKRVAADEEKEKAKKKDKENAHHELIVSYQTLLLNKPSESKWGVSDYKLAVRAFRNDTDRFRVPTKKTDLVALWDKLRSRSAGVEPLSLPPLQQQEGSNNNTASTTTSNSSSTSHSIIMQTREEENDSSNNNEMSKEVFEPLQVPHADPVEDLTGESNLIGLASICTAKLMSETVGEAI